MQSRTTHSHQSDSFMSNWICNTIGCCHALKLCGKDIPIKVTCVFAWVWLLPPTISFRHAAETPQAYKLQGVCTGLLHLEDKACRRSIICNCICPLTTCIESWSENGWVMWAPTMSMQFYYNSAWNVLIWCIGTAPRKNKPESSMHIAQQIIRGFRSDGCW